MSAVYKTFSKILLGFVLGALFMYGFLWWQVYHRANAVMCQVLIGKADIDGNWRCEKLLAK